VRGTIKIDINGRGPHELLSTPPLLPTCPFHLLPVFHSSLLLLPLPLPLLSAPHYGSGLLLLTAPVLTVPILTVQVLTVLVLTVPILTVLILTVPVLTCNHSGGMPQCQQLRLTTGY